MPPSASMWSRAAWLKTGQASKPMFPLGVWIEVGAGADAGDRVVPEAPDSGLDLGPVAGEAGLGFLAGPELPAGLRDDVTGVEAHGAGGGALEMALPVVAVVAGEGGELEGAGEGQIAWGHGGGLEGGSGTAQGVQCSSRHRRHTGAVCTLAPHLSTAPAACIVRRCSGELLADLGRLRVRPGVLTTAARSRTSQPVAGCSSIWRC